jgi:translation initiation factor 2-alpha kinase 4
VFFEMNFPFSTGAERISVIEYLRQVDIIFPPEWPVRLKRQRQSVWLILQLP